MSDRSMTPLPPADFTPTLGDYKDLHSFRFWCQKVLPLVYDDSLSYYELLCKVVDYLNKTMEDVGVLEGDVTKLHEAYKKLQGYVNDYFNSLDVQKEINNKLDAMAKDGSLTELIRNYVDPFISAQNNKINVLEERMNVFTKLPAGSTTADAELIDIRVPASWFNGNKAYPTAGDAVRGQVGSLYTNLGGYIHEFTMSNQYTATFSIPYTTKLYFKLLKHPDAKFSMCKVYGISGETETELTTGVNNISEFYFSINSVYESIKVVVGFGSRVSGNVTVILCGVGELTVSSKTTDNALTLKDLVRSVQPNICGDLYVDVPLIDGKNIVSDFNTCSVDTYLNNIKDSLNGSISSRAIKIRGENGKLFSDIYFITPKERRNDIMCWTFDKEGNPIKGITGEHLNDGFAENVYYIVLVNFYKSKKVHALYRSDKEYVFEVGNNKTYTSVSECLTSIATMPFKKKVLIYSGTYDIYNEIGGDAFANSIEEGVNWRNVSVVAGNNTHIIGVGKVTLTMNPININKNASSLLSPLNLSGNVTVENINIICSNCRYGIHIEGSNIEEYNNTTCKLKNVNVLRNPATGVAQSNRPAIGVGMNMRSTLIIEDCYINAKGGWSALYYHENTANEIESPALRIFNSIFTITSGYAIALSASSNQTTLIDTYIASSYVKSLRKMTGGNSKFNDAYKIAMLNCNMPDISESELMQNKIEIEHYNTIG